MLYKNYLILLNQRQELRHTETFLTNINSLLKFEGWQNKEMGRLKTSTEKRIAEMILLGW